MTHTPIHVSQEKGACVIQCQCGMTTNNRKSLDEAWDEYDEHTMEM